LKSVDRCAPRCPTNFAVHELYHLVDGRDSLRRDGIVDDECLAKNKWGNFSGKRAVCPAEKLHPIYALAHLPEVTGRLIHAQDSDPVEITPGEFQNLIESEVKRWASFV